MVYENTVKYNVPDPAYKNEIWRAKHGYKEVHQHDAPFRRNRDFKATPYGNFAGMPNYRHAEPFCQLKNLKDFKNERHHHPTKWAKTFMFGAAAGIMFGSAWTAFRPVNGFAFNKLLAATGERSWSGRYLRYVQLGYIVN